MAIWWPFGKQREAIDMQGQIELAEMENRNRDVRAKVDLLKSVLDEITEKKRGGNDR